MVAVNLEIVPQKPVRDDGGTMGRIMVHNPFDWSSLALLAIGIAAYALLGFGMAHGWW